MALFSAPTPPEQLVPAPAGEGRDTPISREELVVASAPRSPFAEQFRRLRNSIQALNSEGAARTLVVTSALEGEGKSVAILNLGLALAELPQLRVLVVDANPEHPSLETYLDLPRRQGLQDILVGALDLEAAIRPTSVERLDLLGAGSVPQGPALDVDRVRSLLNSLKRRYDYVLLDAPATLAHSHAGVLGSLADGILIVVRLGRTPKEVVAAAHRMLEELGGNVLGTCAAGAD
jgi:capsular exopolysaccharide synthesis family protein